jgi:glycosidase
MIQARKTTDYAPCGMQISSEMSNRLDLSQFLAKTDNARAIPEVIFARELASRLNPLPEMSHRPVSGGTLNLYALLNRVYRYLIRQHAEVLHPGTLEASAARAGYPEFSGEMGAMLYRFAELFPSLDMITGTETPATYIQGDTPTRQRRKVLLIETMILELATENRALDNFRILFDDQQLAASSAYRSVMAALDTQLDGPPPVATTGMSLAALLRAPLKASPSSLPGQIEYIKEHWQVILPEDLQTELLTAIGIIREEERDFRGGPGRPQVLEFLKGGGPGTGGYDYPEYERFSHDADWMANVVMLAKMVYVWLGQLSREYGREISRLDQIPDEELNRLARWGFTGLWLIGLWERSPASQKIKQIAGNPDAISSAYSLFDYVIAHDLGGEAALTNLRERCRQRGIRLASDMVPNHTGIYSKWVIEHPDWFIQLDYPPYPSYSFNGPNLSDAPEISLNIEDGYWDKRDAAVVFKHYDHRSGRTRYIYHGNDGTSTPWNDTAQLNYLLKDVREAVIQTILHVARQFSIIRFDAAMTLAKKHFQRLWYPQPGHGSGVPSRAEHGMNRHDFDTVFPEEFWREVVDRVAVEAPDTLLLAEAFWLMEGYFVRTLGMHRVYNSAFMNMLKMEENAKYRLTVRNVLEFDHRILQRFVNFMNNPDEKTAVEQFGREGKYFGACALLVTMPGLPMFGHGQIEGFHEKYGMEYRRAYWEEPVDQHLVAAHEQLIFPLMRRRWLFSGSENFVLYDFFSGSKVDENVYAYSNRSGSEKGLVLFNNRYQNTSGWIRTSTSMARETGTGEMNLVQTTLGAALEVNSDHSCYYAFRDCVSGHEYLRSGHELSNQGLYVELGPYEFHAFLDFREIRDDGFDTWGTLCRHLSGRPVVKLDEEVKQVRFAGMNKVFRQLLSLLRDGFGEKITCITWPEAASLLLNSFVAELSVHEETFKNSALWMTAVKADFEKLCGKDPGTAQPAYRSFAEPIRQLFQEESNLTIILAWLFCHRLPILIDQELPGDTALLADQYGLVRGIEKELTGMCAADLDLTPTEEAAAGAMLFRLTLRWQEYFTSGTTIEPGPGLALLLADPQVGVYLHRHESGGREWISRERLEQLLQLLSLAAMVNTEAETGSADTLPAPGIWEQLAQHLAAAEQAGYRVDLLTEAKP